MRHKAFTAINEFLGVNMTSYTHSELNGPLGAADHLALHAIVDNVVTAGYLNIWVEHSGDSEHWLTRNAMPIASGLATTPGDLSFELVVGGAYQLFWADAGQGNTGGVSYRGSLQTPPMNTSNTPLLPYVRLRLVTTIGASCRVKIIAVHRGAR